MQLSRSRTAIGIALLCVPVAMLIYLAHVWSEIHVPLYSITAPDNRNLSITLSELSSSLSRAEEWFVRDFNRSGFFISEYDPRTEAFSKNDSIVQQLLASRLLAENASQSALLLSFHRKNLEYIFSRWYADKGPQGYITYGGVSLLGSNGLALSLLSRSPLSDKYRAQGDALAAAILAAQKSGGNIDVVLSPSARAQLSSSSPSSNSSSFYEYGADAIVGLLDWYQKTGTAAYFNAALKAQDFYLVSYGQRGQSLLAAAPQLHSLYRAYQTTQDAKYAAAAFPIADALVNAQDTVDPDRNRIGSFAMPMATTTESAATATYTADIAYAYAMAQDTGDTARAQTYRNALFLGLYHLTRFQYDDTTANAFASPKLLRGAFSNGQSDPRTAVENTVRGIDALGLAMQLF